MEQEREPLLERSGGDGAEIEAKKNTAAVDLRFATRTWRLLKIARCGDCVLLILLSILSVAITSQAGLVVGHFYNALISKNLKRFVATIGQCLLWYSGESICSATQLWTAEYLAINWRLNLNQTAHIAYCSLPSLSSLSQGNSPDNPDERLTNEISSFCQTLAKLMLKTIAVPLSILYYTCWVWYNVGWIGPVVIYTFFGFGLIVTRMIVSPMARLVARQENLEALFRISHVRFRARGEEIAMYDSLKCEQIKLEEDLKSALTNKKKLVLLHFLLELNTKAYDYLGAVLNYCVLAIPVFGGLFDTDDSGQLANLISNASFAVLQLIYGFSQLMDSAKLVSDIAGHSARIGEVFEFLKILPRSAKKDPYEHRPKHVNGRPIDVRIDSSEFSSSGMTNRHYDVFSTANMIFPPTSFDFGSERTIRMSIEFAPCVLYEDLATIFPGVSPNSLLMISIDHRSILSRGGNDPESRQDISDMLWNGRNKPSDLHLASPSTDRSTARGDISSRLNSCIIKRLESLGHWAGGVDICLRAVSPEEICTEKEERGSNVDERLASVGLVTQSRTANYPVVVSVFTPAPARIVHHVVEACLQELMAPCDKGYEATESSNKSESLKSEYQSLATFTLLPALVVNGVTCFIPGSVTPLVQDLTVELHWGESLLIIGSTGSGKTSILRSLCGLWPLHTGSKSIPPRLNGKGLLILPQRPLMAKAGLAGQITYPDAPPPLESLSSQIISDLELALEAVGMLPLLSKVYNNWEMENDWADTLSPGEQQLLSLARVFYHRPQLVILDEATSAMSEHAEDAIYNLLGKLGITVISVAHRNRLKRYHSKVLEILGDGNGGWLLS